MRPRNLLKGQSQTWQFKIAGFETVLALFKLLLKKHLISLPDVSHRAVAKSCSTGGSDQVRFRVQGPVGIGFRLQWLGFRSKKSALCKHHVASNSRNRNYTMVTAGGPGRSRSKQSSYRRCTSSPGFGSSTLKLALHKTSKGQVLKAMLAIRALTCEQDRISAWSLKPRVLSTGLRVLPGFY